MLKAILPALLVVSLTFSSPGFASPGDVVVHVAPGELRVNPDDHIESTGRLAILYVNVDTWCLWYLPAVAEAVKDQTGKVTFTIWGAHRTVVTNDRSLPIPAATYPATPPTDCFSIVDTSHVELLQETYVTSGLKSIETDFDCGAGTFTMDAYNTPGSVWFVYTTTAGACTVK
jgi:hypothetical protein